MRTTNPDFPGGYNSARDRAVLDEAMGVKDAAPLAQIKGTMLVFDGAATPEDAERHLANVRELAKRERITEDDAVARILATTARRY